MKNKRSSDVPVAVRRVMLEHGFPEPSARAYVLLAYGEAALHG